MLLLRVGISEGNSQSLMYTTLCLVVGLNLTTYYFRLTIVKN
jgi:hypothetical protein